jgi:hypothetical protein
LMESSIFWQVRRMNMSFVVPCDATWINEVVDNRDCTKFLAVELSKLKVACEIRFI